MIIRSYLGFALLCIVFPAIVKASLDSKTRLSSGRHLVHEVKDIPKDASDSKCAPSTLGYDCSWLVCDRIRLHWSLGGSPPNGSEPCTYSGSPRNVSNSGSQNVSASEVHFAVQSELYGYIAMSFTAQYGVMIPADAVIGQVSGDVASVTPYFVEGYHKSDMYLDKTIHLTYSAIVSNATSTNMCFTRSVAETGQAFLTAKMASPNIPLGPGKYALLNFAAGYTSFPSTHSMSKMYLCSIALPLVAVASAEPADRGWIPGHGSSYGKHSGSGSSSNSGSTIVDPVAAENEVHEYMTMHGLVMIVAWLFLMPLGTLAARHKSLITRWFDSVISVSSGSSSSDSSSPLITSISSSSASFPSSGSLPSSLPLAASSGLPPVVGGSLWFLIHRLAQGLAVVFVLIGFVIPFTCFDDGEGRGERGYKSHMLASRLHSVFGISLTVLLGVHLIKALARPKPNASRRPLWLLLHRWTGRVMIAVAAVNVGLGVSLWRTHVSDDSYLSGLWIALAALMVVGFILFDAFLSYVQRQEGQGAIKGDVSSGLTAAAAAAAA
eukprot:CAMPEP_0175045578 /NCGR_PEP_ID=MMETSP0052_2-20121109/4510_1 /TAXON_ID=51329 ORGANISM="Polytomella parva, Strain SAG 63-3" /NCGR_SAMPLE_ID=MMETSP0052_2 /ASSEMBLY_ACC=CAM_ASM_000194 /LENGTH=549 /DNA_ID=CAMNT_0016309143 /DNA_START=43 /DNA_END=1689 /DNA_ORIENTATION=+